MTAAWIWRVWNFGTGWRGFDEPLHPGLLEYVNEVQVKKAGQECPVDSHQH